MKVFLVGYMGCGKSTIGKQLAEKLGYEFIETDKLVEGYVGKSISTIFNFDGENTFRQAENDILHELIQRPHKAIISTGGGMPCFMENMKLMNFFGKTIYLKRTIENLYDILKNDHKHRPLLSDQPDLRAAIELMLEKREICYNKANHIIEITPHETNLSVVNRIAEILESK